MRGSRRLSQAISEGDGISILVAVRDAGAARAAEEQGAEGLVIAAGVEGMREATGLPILWRSTGGLEEASASGADATVLVVERYDEDDDELIEHHDQAVALGLDCVVDVRDEEELELALERIDPEIFLLSGRGAEDDMEPLDHVLELLPDVPAGKLAIAELPVTTREEVVALERAGVDAVIVAGGDVASLVGGPLPDV